MKKRSTLLVVLLSLVCLVCGAIGLAACGDDKDVVIKVGETKISKVDANGATYAVEGDVDKEYVLTVKSKDAVCETVHISMPDYAAYSEGSYGTFSFKYINGMFVKLVSESTVKNVTVVMEEKTYAQGSVKNPIAAEVNKDVNYSVGFDYVYYAVSVSADGSYQINFTGTDADKVAFVYGSTIDEDGEYVLDEASILTFAKDVKYIIGIASNKFDKDGNAVTVTGTFKIVEYVAPQPVNKGALTTEHPVTCDSIDEVGVTVTIQTAVNKTYTITAKKGGQKCTDVTVYAGANAHGDGEATFASNQAESVTVRIQSKTETAVANVTIELTVENKIDIELGTTYTVTYVGGDPSAPESGATGPIKFNFTVTEADNYTITFGGADSSNGIVSYGTESGDLIEFTSDDATHEMAAGEYEFSCESLDWESATYTITVTKAS